MQVAEAQASADAITRTARSGRRTVHDHVPRQSGAGWPTLKPFIAGTQNRLTMAMYEFTAPYIVQAVATAVKQGSFALVLETAMLQEGLSDCLHEHIMVKVLP
jgi:hypothetical protein